MPRWTPRFTHRFGKVFRSLTIWMICLAAAPISHATDPKVPAGLDPGGVAVGILGAGIDYTAPAIANRLARDGEGNPIGFDFINEDGLPFEITETIGNALMRPSTTLASIIAREAPASRLAAFQLNIEDPVHIAKTAAMAGQSPVRIVLIPWTNNRAEDWTEFAKILTHFQNLLVVAAAGDDGQNLDDTPNFPAALKLDNVITVTATDTVGQRLQDANISASLVDIAVPGENILGIAADNSVKAYSGSAVAAARIAAFAARIAAVNPKRSGAELKKQILKFAKPLPQNRPTSRMGWISEPDRIGK